MRVRGLFSWVQRPQLLVACAVLCLAVAAYGANQRVHIARVHGVPHVIAQVKGQSYTAPTVADCTLLPCIALTFDDGPDRRVTPQVLDILAREGIKATFFLVGREVPGKEDLVQRMYKEGHEIGNHTYNHADLAKLPPDGIDAEFNSTQAVISHSGVPVPKVMRPPYGSVTPLVRAHIPVPMIRWDVDTEDWLTKDPAKITVHLLNDVHPGAIILMHDKYQTSADSLEPALSILRQRYQFVTVSQLLDVTAGDQGQFFNRVP